MASPVLVQANFRGRDDDVALNSGTFTHALSTNWTQTTDVKFRIRFTVTETNSRNSNTAPLINYSYNGGAYAAVTTGTSEVSLIASDQSIADDTATSQVISSGTFVAGRFDVTGAVSSALINNSSTEYEYCLIINSANVTDGLHITFRVYDTTTPLTTYTATPDITISVPVTDRNVTKTDNITVAESAAAATGSPQIGASQNITIADTPTVALATSAFEINVSENITAAEKQYTSFYKIPDEADWSDPPFAVISNGGTGEWDDIMWGAYSPTAVVKFGGTYFLYYTGANGDTGDPEYTPIDRSLGVATSTDGIHYTKYSGNPIITYSTGGSVEEGVGSACAIVDGSTIRLYYAAIRDVGGGIVDLDIRYRDSTDGYTFTNDTLIYTVPGDEYQPFAVVYDGSTWSVYIKGPALAGKGVIRRLYGATPTSLSSVEQVTTFTVGGFGGADFVTDDLFVMHIERREVAEERYSVRSIDITDPSALSDKIRDYTFGVYADFAYVTTYLNHETGLWFMYHLDASDNITGRVFNATGLGNLLVGVSDSITVADTPTVDAGVPPALEINVADNITVYDIPHRYTDQIVVIEHVTVFVTGGAFDIDVTDNITISDSSTVSIGAPQVDVSDDITVSESTTTLVGTPEINVSDNVVVSESVSLEIGTPQINVSDNITVAEAATVAVGDLQINVSDNITVAESVSIDVLEAGQINVTVDDDIVVSETVTATVSAPQVSVTENITVSETVNVAVGALADRDITVTDNITVAETTDLDIVTQISVAQNIVVLEATDEEIVTVVTVSENITVAESLDVDLLEAGQINVTVDDDIFVSEAVVLTVSTSQVTVSETVTVTDSPTVAVLEAGAVNVSASDNVVVSETVGSAVSAPQIDTSQSITVTDSPSLAVLDAGVFSVSIAETITVSEAKTIVVGISVDETQNITISETTDEAVVTAITETQNITVSDVDTVLVGSPQINVSDGVTITESIALDVGDPQINVAQNITVNDSVTVSVLSAGVLAVATTQNITVSEQKTLAVSAPQIDVDETITLSDSATVFVGAAGAINVTVAENIEIAETVGVFVTPLPTLSINKSESIEVTESFSAQIGALQITKVDNITISDNDQEALRTSIAVTDSIVMSESLAEYIALSLTISDNITLSDDATVIVLTVSSITIPEGLFKRMFSGMDKYSYMRRGS